MRHFIPSLIKNILTTRGQNITKLTEICWLLSHICYSHAYDNNFKYLCNALEIYKYISLCCKLNVNVILLLISWMIIDKKQLVKTFLPHLWFIEIITYTFTSIIVFNQLCVNVYILYGSLYILNGIIYPPLFLHH